VKKLRRACAVVTFAAGAALLTGGTGRADLPFAPWIDEGDVPPPRWARSVAPKAGENGAGDLVLFSGPTRAAARRGVTAPGASLRFFGGKRGSGCSGNWWLVGPLAWACSDDANLAATEPVAPGVANGPDGLPMQYFFVGRDGTSAYVSLDTAEDGAADREFERGWAVGVVEQQTAHGGRWGRTSKGLWIAMRDLAAARPSLFRGELIEEGRLDVAWVVADHANVWPTASPKDKPKDQRGRFQLVHVREGSGPMVQVDEGAWMLARDLARPTVAPPPADVAGAGERWIDVELATQTLVAYEGLRPAYATLVSTGRGAAGTPSATPVGAHRIWVKMLTSDMDNVERDDLEEHYSMEAVPYVQFFDKAVALHGTYWHRDFGRVKSHGCVNLAPLDARWLFAFTGPRLPAGWVATYPTSVDEGTVVRVR
jgi:hypothetical protein